MVATADGRLTPRARQLLVFYAKAHQRLGAAVVIEERHAAAIQCAEYGGLLREYIAELEAVGRPDRAA